MKCVVLLSNCCLSDQRYNFLKANHNVLSSVVVLFSVVYQIKDTIFWKQITTHRHNGMFDHQLFIRSKIQFFESKSQPNNPCPALSVSCLSDQRYNFLKANHNRQICNRKRWIVVYQIKDTIFWKQITTRSTCTGQLKMLFIRSKIQFFESKSQRTT